MEVDDPTGHVRYIREDCERNDGGRNRLHVIDNDRCYCSVVHMILCFLTCKPLAQAQNQSGPVARNIKMTRGAETYQHKLASVRSYSFQNSFEFDLEIFTFIKERWNRKVIGYDKEKKFYQKNVSRISRFFAIFSIDLNGIVLLS